MWQALAENTKIILDFYSNRRKLFAPKIEIFLDSSRAVEEAFCLKVNLNV